MNIRVLHAVFSKYDSDTNKIWLRWPIPFETTRQEERPTDTLLVPGFFEQRHSASFHLYDMFDYYLHMLLPRPLNTDATIWDLPIGVYTVTATDQVTGCISDPASIEILDMTVIPELDFRVGPSVCLNPTGFVEVIVTNQAIGETYNWSNITPENGSNNVPSDRQTGWYNIFSGTYEVTVTSIEGCVNTAQVEVGTETQGYQLITPDKNTNDYFFIDCIDQFPNNTVKVFTRTGIKVYETSGYDNGTNVFNGLGKNGLYLMGEKVPDGTYYYIIDRGDGSKPEVGFIEIIRN